jgi:putative ATP-dependent endonuclease of OLD family
MASNQGKGWFAILLGKNISHKTVLPVYIWKAIFFAKPTLTRELFFNIYSYRLRYAAIDGLVLAAAVAPALQVLEKFREGTISLAALKAQMMVDIPGDQIHAILAQVD